jgi:hypothetical protein
MDCLCHAPPTGLAACLPSSFFTYLKHPIMFSFFKKGWAGLAALVLFISVFAMQSFSAATAIGNGCSCGAPSSPSVTSQSAVSITLAWSPGYGALNYEVWYVRTNDSYTSSVSTVSSASINYTGLASGTYRFYFRSNCDEGKSDIIVLEDIIIG